MDPSGEQKQAEAEDLAGVEVGTDVAGTASDVPVESGVQIAEGPEQAEQEESEENAGLELGDLVEFHSTRADLETVKGRIYYIDESRISILEEGKSRKLVVFDMEKDEDDEIVFLPEYEITEVEIKEKRLLPSFVAQRGMAKDMMVETFTAEGDAVTTYKIQTVDEKTDSATLVDDAGEVLDLKFEFKGIPRDRSTAPFDVLRVIEPPKTEPAVPNEAAAGEVEEEVLDFEFLDELEAPEVEPIAGLFKVGKKPVWEILYNDDEQLNDMLRERIQELDPVAQRSVKRIRDVTRLVWSMLSLRNDITRYSGDKPVGRKPAAFNTLVELLEKTQFPLVKQVLNVAKGIYVDHSSEDLTAYERGSIVDPDSIADPAIRLHYLQDIVIKATRYLDFQLKDNLIEAAVPGGTRKIPRWITIWQGYYNKYFMVIAPLREDDDVRDVKYDMDFFRLEIPELEEAGKISGLPVLNADAKTKVDISYLGKLPFSYMRALGPRYGRYGEGGMTHKIEDADQAEIKGYLLFPLGFLRDLGYIRSGKLAIDVAFGMKTPMTMQMILKQAGEITDIPEANKIISVNFDGSTLGNTEIADWLKGQALYGGGIGDLMPYLRSFGMLQAEFTLAQKLVLDQKVATYRSAVKKLIKEARDSIFAKRKERKPIQTFPLLNQQRVYELFLQVFGKDVGEPILQQMEKDFVARFPSYIRDDVAKFAYLYVTYPDLLLNTLAQNPDLAKERMRAERDLYIREVMDKLEEEKKLQDRGEPPQPNPCQHVKDLNKIRRIPNNTERMLTLNLFLKTYKLKKEDHWLWCNNGEPPHHLLCEHEYLLLQEFLRPKEKEVIHKELILTFGGGKFNGQYICRQCGQPIADYEYDTHLEYDDSGRPMSGREVLVDEDALEEERLQRALTTEAEEEERVETTSEDEVKIYKVIAELAGLVGIFPDRKSYQTMIGRVKNGLAAAPDRAKYAQSQKRLKKAGQVSTDYDVFISRILVSLCAGALIIDVQTHIPEYIIRYTMPGCASPEFSGYPRDPDVRKPETAMEYLACAISSIQKRTEPWDLTGYQSISSTKARLDEIMKYLKAFTTQLAEKADVQQAIVDKKQYLLETFGYETALGRPSDMIPYGFTPAPFVPTKELAAEAESPVVVESASDAEKVRAYIKQAHVYALKYGKYMPGVGFSETACCYSDLIKPAEFWRTRGNLPELPPLEPPQGMKGSLLFVKMSPRPLETLFAKADASIMYRLFLRVCFRGPRIGQQHEPGYNQKCPWCDFQFAEDPRLPPPTRRYSSDREKQKKFDEEYQSVLANRRSLDLNALREAGITDITTEQFEELLTDVNRRTLLPALPDRTIPTPIENFRGVLSLNPVPFEDFEEVIRATLVALEALPPDAPRRDLINAFTDLSNKTVALENEIRSRLGDANFANYQELMKLPPQELGEALRSYILIPFQRILTTVRNTPREFSPVIKASTTKEFSAEVMADLREAYNRHTDYLNTIERDIPKGDRFIKEKMREVTVRLSEVIPFFLRVLRPTIVRGGALASSFLQRCIVAGIFAEFIMPNHIPFNDPGLTAPTSAITTPAKMPAKILQACLLKYRQEGLAYSQEQIREMIQDRIEKEKAKVIRDKSDMTPEQRKLDNMLQRLGMGKWAVGGTKAIWRYDPNQYISEKDAMAAAGITRFGPEMDVYEREGGYDVVQTGEDDA